MDLTKIKIFRNLDEMNILFDYDYKQKELLKYRYKEKKINNFPTWDVEKKVLNAIFLKHLHSESKIALSDFKTENNYLDNKFKIDEFGKNFNKVFENLEHKGFIKVIKDNSEIEVTNEGFKYALLVHKMYSYKKKRRGYRKLLPNKYYLGIKWRYKLLYNFLIIFAFSSLLLIISNIFEKVLPIFFKLWQKIITTY